MRETAFAVPAVSRALTRVLLVLGLAFLIWLLTASADAHADRGGNGIGRDAADRPKPAQHVPAVAEAARDKGVKRLEESAQRSTGKVEKAVAQARETVRRTSAVIDDADETVRRAVERAKQAVGQDVNRVVDTVTDTVTDVVPAQPRDPSAPALRDARDGAVSSSQQGVSRLHHLAAERVDLTRNRLDGLAPTNAEVVTFRAVDGTDSLSASHAQTDLPMDAPELPDGAPLPGCAPTVGAAPPGAPAAATTSAAAASLSAAVRIDGSSQGFSSAPAFSPGCTPD